MRPPRLSLATRTAIWYVLFGAIWIVLSDRTAEALFPDPGRLTLIQTYKGWLFVLASGLFLLFYLARENKLRRDIQKEFADLFGQTLEGIYQAKADGAYLKVNPALA